ncbi:hypothetical protein L9Z41_08815 [Leptospira noguchii]|uniref:hypothetical protein n=1 Tax=Leptospira noguchii TaxID=28182 RepID=UPI001F05C372|nr:hypothetical protein [Leptospira noguchii]MCH1912074.1 hypothetical protein [Leptospira noguchii]MCH1915734.1 hypothetical protein [Leptospira noguchii]UOG63190.1 hypothetical protein MAL04_12700 [Leptospira noguchii]
MHRSLWVALETQCIAPYGSLWKLNASLPMGRSGNSMHRSLWVALETQCIAPYGSLCRSFEVTQHLASIINCN